MSDAAPAAVAPPVFDIASLPPHPHRDDVPDAVHAWIAHLDGGRLGAPRPAPDPAVLAAREAADAVFRGRAARAPRRL